MPNKNISKPPFDIVSFSKFLIIPKRFEASKATIFRFCHDEQKNWQCSNFKHIEDTLTDSIDLCKLGNYFNLEVVWKFYQRGFLIAFK